MNRRQFVLSLAGTATVGWTGWNALSGSLETAGLREVTRHFHALGTSVAITALHADEAAAGRAIEAGFRELQRVEAILSLYQPQSEVSRLNRNAFLPSPSPELCEVLNLASSLSRRTFGAFDITVQPLWELYASLQGRKPSPKKLEAVRRAIDYRRVRMETDAVRLLDGARITLNGIAQGLAADAVGRVLRQHGVRSALVDTGEIGAVGRKEKRPWKIGVKDPRQPGRLSALTSLENRCLATSGDYESAFTEDFRLHHLLDPRTGQSPPELASVSVAAPGAMLADGLSTAAFVLGAEEGQRLIENFPGADALFITKNGTRRQTGNFPAIF